MFYYIIIIITSIISGLITYIISNKLNKGPVLGSSIVVLISGIFLPHFFGELGINLALVSTASSYSGMVATKNIPNLYEMAIVGFITGIVFILVDHQDVFSGVGGKLGTIAGISCLTWIGFRKVFLSQDESKKINIAKIN